MAEENERLQNAILDLFDEEEDDDMFEPATDESGLSGLSELSGLEDDTEAESFTGRHMDRDHGLINYWY